MLGPCAESRDMDASEAQRRKGELPLMACDVQIVEATSARQVEAVGWLRSEGLLRLRLHESSPRP